MTDSSHSLRMRRLSAAAPLPPIEYTPTWTLPNLDPMQVLASCTRAMQLPPVHMPHHYWAISAFCPCDQMVLALFGCLPPGFRARIVQSSDIGRMHADGSGPRKWSCSRHQLPQHPPHGWPCRPGFATCVWRGIRSLSGAVSPQPCPCIEVSVKLPELCEVCCLCHW